METKLTQLLLESWLPITIFGLIALYLAYQYFFPSKPHWIIKYRDMVKGYEEVRVHDDAWATKYPNMSIDVRLWNVLRDLEEEYDASHNEKLVDIILKLKKLHSQSKYFAQEDIY